MTSFLKNVALNLSSPAHYGTHRNKSFLRSLGYLYCLLVLVYFIASAVFALNNRAFVPAAQEFANNFLETASTLFPEDLELNFKNGELSINKPEPFFIEIPYQWRAALQASSLKSDQPDSNITNLLAIDTTGTSENFHKYRTLALLTRTAFVSKGEDSKLDVVLFSSRAELDQPVVITYVDYKKVVDNISPYLDYIAPILTWLFIGAVILLPPIYAVFAGVGYLILALICALVVWIIAQLASWKFSYDQILTLTVYGLTVPLVVQLLFWLFSATLPTGVFSLLLIGWMVVVAKHLKNGEQSPPVIGAQSLHLK